MGRRRFLDGDRRRARTPILAALVVAIAASASAARFSGRASVQDNERVRRQLSPRRSRPAAAMEPRTGVAGARAL